MGCISSDLYFIDINTNYTGASCGRRQRFVIDLDSNHDLGLPTIAQKTYRVAPMH
jgi:hypothetical protein